MRGGAGQSGTHDTVAVLHIQFQHPGTLMFHVPLDVVHYPQMQSDMWEKGTKMFSKINGLSIDENKTWHPYV